MHDSAREALVSRGFHMPEFNQMNETSCPPNGCSGEKKHHSVKRTYVYVQK